jgi:CheY-like chemotaxis protein
MRLTEVSILVAGRNDLLRQVRAAAAPLVARLRHVASADLAIETALAEDFDLLLLDTELSGIGATAAADILRRAGCPSLLVALIPTPIAAVHAGEFDEALALPLPAGRLQELCQRAAARRCADPELRDWNFDDLTRQFRAELPATLDAVRAAAHDRDLEGLRRILHRLKGSAGNFGFPDVSRTCLRIETLFREGSVEAALSESLVLANIILKTAPA